MIKEAEGITTGLDGVSYYFSTIDSSGTLVTGQTWSPRKSSKMGKLVSICDQLVDMTKKEIEDTSKLKLEIKELIAELKN